MVWFASDPAVLAGGEGGEPVPGRPGDVCPQGWEESFDRAQMTTQVFIARALPSEIPELDYQLAAGTAPPGPGQVTFNPGQLGPGTLQIHRTSTAGDMYTWLQYLAYRSTVRVYDPADPKITLTYTVTGSTTFTAGTWFQIPVVWSEGEGDDGAPISPRGVRLKLTLVAEPPQLWEDTLGKSLYGPQPLSRTDLINTSTALFETLADRILEVRGVNSVPRIEAVTLDARTGHGTRNAELMSSARPEKPSRYRMRLQVDERPIFDRMCFASNVRHFIARDEWTTRIALDIAEWAGQL